LNEENEISDSLDYVKDSMEPDSLEPFSKCEEISTEMYDSLEVLEKRDEPITEQIKTTTFLEISKRANQLNLEEVSERKTIDEPKVLGEVFRTEVLMETFDQPKPEENFELIDLEAPDTLLQNPCEREDIESPVKDETPGKNSENILKRKSLTLDLSIDRNIPQIVVYESPTKRRYNSPLFQNLADPLPIIKLTPPTISDDGSISNLLYTSSLISQTIRERQTTPTIDYDEDEKIEVEIESENFVTSWESVRIESTENSLSSIDEPTVINNVGTGNLVEIEKQENLNSDKEILKIESSEPEDSSQKTKKKIELTEILKSDTNNTNIDIVAPKHKISLTENLVTETTQDPAEVLLDNLIPGSIAEREHKKWLNAAPIKNNPYSAEALQKRLSDTDNRRGLIDINNQVVDALVEESKAHDSGEELEDEILKPISKQINYDR
jgi:hypothetical protein